MNAHTLSPSLLPSLLPWTPTVPPLFLLIASRTDVRRISMDPSLNDYNDVSLVSGLNNTLAIDYRLTAIGEGQMIFTDKILDTIYTANFDGSGIMIIVI